MGSRLLGALLCASALFTVVAASLPRFDLAGAAFIVTPLAGSPPSHAPRLERIGPPNRRLRAAVWLYYRCRAIDVPSVADDGAGVGGMALSAVMVRSGFPRSTSTPRKFSREKAQKAQTG